MELPSYEAFNRTMDELLNSLKYLKFHKVLLEMFVRLLEKIWAIFEKLFLGRAAGAGLDSGLKIILGGLILLVVVLIVVLTVVFFFRRRKRRHIKSIMGETIDRDSSVASFIERSGTLEQDGKYREAVRLRFIAVLLYLHQNHVLYHDHTMTGSEMVARLYKNKYIGATGFQSLVDDFNETWYGMRELEPDAFRDWCDREELFWQEVQRP